MRSLNKVMLIGNLGADPEIRHTPGGSAVANFRMATTEVFKDRGGNTQQKTEWHRIVAWARLAEICEQYLRKGHRVYIEGRIQTREWEDQKSGQKRWSTEIVATNMLMLSGRGEGGGYEGAEVGAGRASAGAGAGDGDAAGRRGAADPDSGYTPDSSLDPIAEEDDLPF
jgi:single-strand DNA-binding protein